ncbi:P-type conjugative transfer ATPase TrbB [Persicimonas caeni]|nr:P-type conjugative transfer ATPase TrbB [Persicimonas caeni]
MNMLEHSCGPELWQLLNDELITEVMANPDGRVWVEKFSVGMVDSGVRVRSAEVESIINIVASSADEVCNRQKPSLAAVLPESGARFQGFVPPVVPAPMFVIRQRATRVFSLQDYVDDGYMSYEQAKAIYEAVVDRQNVLIVGGTGSGKTTLANAILQVISGTEDRVLTIEDTPELQCTAPNHIAFYIDRDSGFTWQKAVKDSLRSRPDRIVVGEVRDASALDLLKAWNTGHNGGCATIHANSALRGLTRLESLIEEAIPRAPVQLIAEAVNLVVYIEGTATGREVKTVARVMCHDGQEYQLQEV